ncbi:hypothetical protein DESPIG_00011 [Desulfovibrio piger ATCC 29098]|uniref:Uncharacterized protein n=1 Tax=Desulfovibrio piger ATCC 29098 TaxID=411464 RepID=B6WPP6_9BACT|nr:hypothetical protein DESPIG_00011 [Desulfovibrio piger ATCC 29098]
MFGQLSRLVNDDGPAAWANRKRPPQPEACVLRTPGGLRGAAPSVPVPALPFFHHCRRDSPAP